MKLIVLLILIICIFNFSLCHSQRGGKKHQHHHQKHHSDSESSGDDNIDNSSREESEYSFQPPSTKENPIRADQSCLVNPQYTSCFSNTCPNVTSCVSYLNGQTSYNIFVQSGTYNKCLGTLSITSATVVSISSLGPVTYDCNSSNGLFFNLTSGFQAINFTLNGFTLYNGRINVLGTTRQSVFNLINCSLTDVYGSSSLNVPNFITNVRDSRFLNSFSSQNGGAINANNLLVVERSQFSDCNANGKGGAIYAQTVDIIDSSFISCNGATGGAVYSALTTVKNSLFKFNSASDTAGAIFSTDALNILNSSFQNNTANLNAGAIYYSTNAPMQLVQVSFDYNNGGYNGGAIYLSNAYASIYMTSTEFTNNFVAEENESGAIYVTGPNNTLLVGGIFNYISPDLHFTPFSRYYLSQVQSVQIAQPSDCTSRPVTVEFGNPNTPYFCIGVTGTCKYGHAFVNENGQIINCTCYLGYMGENCTEPIPSSSSSLSSSSSAEESSSSSFDSSSSSFDSSSSSFDSSSSSFDSSSSSTSVDSSSSEEPNPFAWAIGIIVLFISAFLLVYYVIKYIFHHHQHHHQYSQLVNNYYY